MRTKSELSVTQYRTPQKVKVFIGVLILTIVSLVFWNKISTPINSVLMAPYNYSETGDLVSVRGSWLSSDTALANPLQTTQIECWERFGHCFVYYAELKEDNYLSVNSETYEIQSWTNDTILTKPNKFGCVDYQLSINRRAETVTNIRLTTDNTSELCKGIQKEPITLTLGDGLKRIEQGRTSK